MQWDSNSGISNYSHATQKDGVKYTEEITKLGWMQKSLLPESSPHPTFQNQAGSCRIIQVILHHAPGALRRFTSYAARCGAALQPAAPKARGEKGEQESVWLGWCWDRFDKRGKAKACFIQPVVSAPHSLTFLILVPQWKDVQTSCAVKTQVSSDALDPPN